MFAGKTKKILAVGRVLKTEEWVALAVCGGALLANILLYAHGVSLKDALFWMLYYFTFGDPFYALFFIFVYFFFLGEFYLLLSSLVTARVLGKKPFPSGSAKRLGRLFLRPLRFIAPLAFTGLFFPLLLSNTDYALRLASNDTLFFHLDRLLLGNSPFFSLPALFPQHIFISIFQYAYFSLSFVMSGMLAILFLVSRENLFRKAIVSLLLSLAIAFPFFYALPCQDPSHYFLENMRGNAFPKDVEQLRSAYRPSSDALALIKRIDESETDKERDNAVPVSCFPSMHAVWSFFVVFFLARVRKWSLALTLPWVTLVLTGGLYVAQHYAVDYVVALPVAAASIWLAGLLLRKESTSYGIAKR